MKRNNSISRTFPFGRSYNFPKVELKKRFSDIFSSISLKKPECEYDNLTPSYPCIRQEPIKMKKEMIFVPEINDYIEVEIAHDRNVIRTKQELLTFTSIQLPKNENDLIEEEQQKCDAYFTNYLLPDTKTNSSIYSKDKESDTYSIDSYYYNTDLPLEKKRRVSISSINSIYTQSDSCSLLSLSTVSSSNSILGKYCLLKTKNKTNRNSI